jgi:hypothetical protein
MTSIQKCDKTLTNPNPQIHPIFTHKLYFFLLSLFSLGVFFSLFFFFSHKVELLHGLQHCSSSSLFSSLSSPALYHIYRRVTSWLRNFFFKKTAATFNCCTLFLSLRLSMVAALILRVSFVNKGKAKELMQRIAAHMSSYSVMEIRTNMMAAHMLIFRGNDGCPLVRPFTLFFFNC